MVISRLLRIELDDELFFNVFGDVFACRNVEELTTLSSFVPFDPGVFSVVETCEVVNDYFERFALFTNADNSAGFNVVRGDVDNLAVNNDVAVEHDLTSSSASFSNTEAVNYVVETAFEELKEYFTGDAFSAFSLSEEVAELTFENTVGVFSFLLFAELSAVF